MPRKFDFVSPGISIEEIDESIIETPATEDGIVIIGRSRSGPSMRPTKVKNLADFTSVFGKPVSGKGTSNNDIWRDGNNQSPTYAAYAAQAWLASETSPVTFIRLAGNDTPTAERATGYIKAGWDLGGDQLEAATGDHKHNVTAYGLFITPSSSVDEPGTGTLAAVIYATGSVITLSGTIPTDTGTVTTSSVGCLIKSAGSVANTFTVEVRDSFAETTAVEKLTFHFDPDKKDKYIRNVLSTNPLKTNSNNYGESLQKKYFLGETYEEAVQALVSGSTAAKQYGLILPLVSSSANLVTHHSEARAGRTGWIISRDPTPQENTGSFSAANMKKLFRLVSLHDGEWFQNNYYATFDNLKLGTVANPNSTFSVSIRKIGSGEMIEQFSNCNLDESSENFIGKKIGDMHHTWNSTNDVFDISGDYPNRSDYVRVEMADDWKSGIDDSYMIPWGNFGPIRPKGFTIMSASIGSKKVDVYPLGTTHEHQATNAHVYVKGFQHTLQTGGDSTNFIRISQADYTGSFAFPRLKLTEENTNKASANYKGTDMFGVRHKFASKNESGVMPKRDFIDLLRFQGGDIDLDVAANATEYSYVFSLDEVVKDANGDFYWKSGSHAYVGAQGEVGRAESAASGSQKVIDHKIRQFAVPFHGGFDGVDIALADPFSSEVALKDKAKNSSYAFNSLDRAIDMCRSDESLKFDVISIPGLTNEPLNRDLIDAVEHRGDSLAIIDIDDGFLQSYENSGTRTDGSLTSFLNNVDARDYNTSYAACYHPRVRTRDTLSGNGDVIILPASVAAVGALGFSDSETGAPWFAPAGFNRGGLKSLGGQDGPQVVGALRQLSKANRDDLYQRNINPIARFPAIGETVIFGQKTLQQTKSALDRVNVRRLMIFLKKRVGRVAETILFDQNVKATWSRFEAGADLILRDAQDRLGITEYKLVLDETTTTADLVDRNILYAKVFVKPARAIEYIAIDFVITKSGIEF